MRPRNWDKYEVALLIESADKINRGVARRDDETKKLSGILRNRAQLLGEEVNEQFRNYNGISLQLAAVESLLFPCDVERHYSRLFEEIVDLFNNDADLFNAILSEAHRQI